MRQIRQGLALLLVAGVANLWLTNNVNRRADQLSRANSALAKAQADQNRAEAERAATGDATVSQFRDLAAELQASLDQIIGELREQVQALQATGALTQAQAGRLLAVGSPSTITAGPSAPSTSPAVPAPSSAPPTSTAPSSPTTTTTLPPSCLAKVLVLSLCASE